MEFRNFSGLGKQTSQLETTDLFCQGVLDREREADTAGNSGDSSEHKVILQSNSTRRLLERILSGKPGLLRPHCEQTTKKYDDSGKRFVEHMSSSLC